MYKKLVGTFVCMLFITIAVLPVSGTLIEDGFLRPLSKGNTIYVGGSGPNNYTTIQDGVDAANEGDTVFVYDDSSPYYEHVLVGKSLTLVGEDKETTIIDGNGSSIVVHFITKLISISGFTIRNGFEGIRSDEQGQNDTISGNIITDNNWSISLGGGYHTVTRNTISNSNIGIIFIWSSTNKITHNNFIQNKIHATFWRSHFNLWLMNYWGRPRLLPKPIFGLLTAIPPVPWIQFDLLPAKTLN